MFEVFLFWFCLALVVGVAANTRGRSGFGWFLLACIISPLISGLLVLALPRHSPSAGRSTKASPYCAEPIQPAAIVCRHCGRDLNTGAGELIIEQPPPAPVDPPAKSRGAIVRGDGRFGFNAVGEAHYQSELERIAGRRTEEGVEHECVAFFVPEPDNPYDPNAISVRIEQRTVGYVPRQQAAAFSDALAAGNFQIAASHARVVGGWDRGEEDRGHFGVVLDIVLPFDLQLAPLAENRAQDEPVQASRRSPRVGAPIPTRLIVVGAVTVVLLVAMWAASLPTNPPAAEVIDAAGPSDAPITQLDSKAPTPTALPGDVPLPRNRPALPSQQ